MSCTDPHPPNPSWDLRLILFHRKQILMIFYQLADLLCGLGIVSKAARKRPSTAAALPFFWGEDFWTCRPTASQTCWFSGVPFEKSFGWHAQCSKSLRFMAVLTSGQLEACPSQGTLIYWWLQPNMGKSGERPNRWFILISWWRIVKLEGVTLGGGWITPQRPSPLFEGYAWAMLTSAAGEFEVFANAPWFGDKLQGQNMEIRWSILVANHSTVISPKKWKINHHWNSMVDFGISWEHHKRI